MLGIMYSRSDLSWTQFLQCCTGDPRLQFEEMTRRLFSAKYLKREELPRSETSHPGIEVAPILEPVREDGAPQKRISFQSKFFDKRVSYRQIKKSAEIAAKHFKGQLDTIYLFCNLMVNPSRSSTYKDTVRLLRDADIELIPISDTALLDLLFEYDDIACYYFLPRMRTYLKRDVIYSINRSERDHLTAPDITPGATVLIDRRADIGLVHNWHSMNNQASSNEDVFDRKTSSTEVYESYLWRLLHEIRSDRKSGKPREVVKRANDTMFWIDQLLDKHQTSGFRTYLLEQKIRFLMEESKSYMDFVLPEQVFSYMGSVNDQLFRTAGELRDSKLYYLPMVSEESAYYVGKEYYRSYNIGKELLQNIDGIDEEWHIEILRAAAINNGYVGSLDELETVVSMICNYVNLESERNINDLVFLCEGVARAYGMHGSEKAIDYIEKARQLLDQMVSLYGVSSETTELRAVQLLRTEGIIVSKAGTIDDLERLCKRGIDLSTKNHYDRYIREFNELNLRRNL